MIVFEHADVLDAAAGALLKDRFVRVEGTTIAAVSDKNAPTRANAHTNLRQRMCTPTPANT